MSNSHKVKALKFLTYTKNELRFKTKEKWYGGPTSFLYWRFASGPLENLEYGSVCGDFLMSYSGGKRIVQKEY